MLLAADLTTSQPVRPIESGSLAFSMATSQYRVDSSHARQPGPVIAPGPCMHETNMALPLVRASSVVPASLLSRDVLAAGQGIGTLIKPVSIASYAPKPPHVLNWLVGTESQEVIDGHVAPDGAALARPGACGHRSLLPLRQVQHVEGLRGQDTVLAGGTTGTSRGLETESGGQLVQRAEVLRARTGELAVPLQDALALRGIGRAAGRLRIRVGGAVLRRRGTAARFLPQRLLQDALARQSKAGRRRWGGRGARCHALTLRVLGLTDTLVLQASSLLQDPLEGPSRGPVLPHLANVILLARPPERALPDKVAATLWPEQAAHLGAIVKQRPRIPAQPAGDYSQASTFLRRLDDSLLSYWLTLIHYWALVAPVQPPVPGDFLQRSPAIRVHHQHPADKTRGFCKSTKTKV